MNRQKCSACGQRFPSLPTDNRSRYCYQHQVYDSLVSEYKTVLNAYSTNTYWEEFLIIKLNGNEPTDVNKILDAELKQPDGHNYRS